ncbi:MAG: amidohydrolase [Anaerolineae bacterium]|nr:amidohydrolase [Anaerolineae bacterium]
MRADLLLYNGRVYTMDPGQPSGQAVAMTGNRILAVGSDAELRPLLRPGAPAVDLGGRAVIPGLIDAHVHFGSFSIGTYQNRVDLDNVPTKAEALARVAQAAAAKQAGAWIQGAGWNKNLWPGAGFPTASDLDAIAPDHPVALQDKSHHATWVNSRALEVAGISANTPDPPGGQIVRDEQGEPTGMLLETAADQVFEAIPEPDVQMAVAALRQGIAHAQRLGLTGVHDPGHAIVLSALQMLRAEGELGLRALVHIPSGDLGAAVDLGLCSGFGDDVLRIGGVKLFADGALGPQTAHMLAPYEGELDNVGIPTHTQEELFDLVRQAHQVGLSVAVHAIGDAANRAVLDAIERSPCPAGSPLPDRIEHVQILHPDDVPRLSKLGVVASMQPIHATSDMDMAERYWGRRCELAYAWRSVWDSGATLAFGSDCPVETLDPLAGIHAAVTRRRADGSPGPEGWIPSQRLTVEQAVHAYTLGAAGASAEADMKGSLVSGKLADLVVLSRDIFRIEPMEILDARVKMTVFDGRIVYEA